jgi:uncharacterized repeat protein (TIGR03943 family)
MTHNRYRLLQIILLSCLAIFLAERLVTGKLLWYINARFAVLTLLGILGLSALVINTLYALRHSQHAAESHAEHHDHEHSHSAANLIWLILPLALGVLIPARPLGSDAAANKGVTLAGPLAAGNNQTMQLDAAPDKRTVLDWIRIFNFEPDLNPYLGETANVIGFVYADPRLPTGHFLVARFTVSCCVADAFAIGMAVRWPEQLPTDQWVIVRGPVQVLEIDQQKIPLILAESITPIDEPAQPYLFP